MPNSEAIGNTARTARMWSALRQIAAHLREGQPSRRGAPSRQLDLTCLSQSHHAGGLPLQQPSAELHRDSRTVDEAGGRENGYCDTEAGHEEEYPQECPPKAAPKKRVRKVLTPEEKRQVEIRELKKAALLKQPPKLPDRTWTVYVAQNVKGTKPGAEASPRP